MAREKVINECVGEKEHQLSGKQMVRAILFDLDGVLVLTDKYHCQAWKRLCDEQGWDFSDQVFDSCRGLTRKASLEVILKHNNVALPDDQKEALATRKNGYFKRFLKTIDETALYPGVVEFLQRLSACNLKLGVCSSSQNAGEVLDRLDIRKFFQAVVTGNEIQQSKPHPEVFLLGARRLGIDARDCIVFEDAPSGVEAALAAKMKCVGVGSPEVLAKAQRVIQRYSEIDTHVLLRTRMANTQTHA